MGRWFNFEDSGDRVERSDCLFWLARRFDLPVCAWVAGAGTPSARGMIWYRDAGKDPVQAALPLDKYWRGVEVATLRSAWNDRQATFVGVQSGSNLVNHNHLDLGSFVLDALGQRWALDLGGDDYNLPGYFGRQRYEYYRLRAEGHNTLVINPGEAPDQDPESVGRISRFVSEKDRAFAICDLTPGYAKHARRVERGVALLDRREVLVQDEIEGKRPMDVWWFMHTRAKVTAAADGRSAVLEQGKARLAVRLLAAPADARFEIRAAAPFPSSPHPAGQDINEGVRKLAVHLPHVESLRLAVLFTPNESGARTGRHGQRGAQAAVRPLGEW
jgi:hypothetical protein